MKNAEKLAELAELIRRAKAIKTPLPTLIGHWEGLLNGPGGGTRTRTPLRILDFKSNASAISPHPE